MLDGKLSNTIDIVGAINKVVDDHESSIDGLDQEMGVVRDNTIPDIEGRYS